MIFCDHFPSGGVASDLEGPRVGLLVVADLRPAQVRLGPEQARVVRQPRGPQGRRGRQRPRRPRPLAQEIQKGGGHKPISHIAAVKRSQCRIFTHLYY